MVVIALVTAAGPLEKTLGANARIVYLHGAWVWASLAAFLAAGVVGVVGLVARRQEIHRWSRALGRTGLTFWITYLPISMWAMQTSWNGLFLAEPRWRMAIVFAVAGLMLQVGFTLLENPAWASAGNFLYILLMLVILNQTQNVMHPPSPMLDSEASRIQLFFGILVLLALAAAWQVARWWHRFEHRAIPSSGSGPQDVEASAPA
jgi:hypothetical protein